MKFLTFILIFGLSPLIASANISDEMTSEREAIVLAEIDDVCGDTWCGGDFSFEFDSLTAKNGVYTLDFKMGLDENNLASVQCQFPYRVSYSDFITEGPLRSGGVYRSIKTSFYDELTDCIHEIEQNMPRRIVPSKTGRVKVPRRSR